MKPTVGRIVHYTNLGDADGRYPPAQQAAIITKVRIDLDRGVEEGSHKEEDERHYSVSLHIFYEDGEFNMRDVPFSSEFKRGHWTWPPRV
jgi:hypothetical protein